MSMTTTRAARGARPHSAPMRKPGGESGCGPGFFGTCQPSTPASRRPAGRGAAFHRLAHPDGEIATSIGAARAGALYVMSTRSSRRIEDVAAASTDAGGTWWFQVYLMRDRELTAGLVAHQVDLEP